MSNNRVICESNENLLKRLLKDNIFINNPCNGKGTCGKCKVKVISGELSPICSSEKELLTNTEINQGIRLACFAEASGPVELMIIDQERSHKILTGGYVPNFEKDFYHSGYGIAIDIGTTTVVTSLIDMKTGDELASSSMINAQKHFGLDVLTRITYEFENPETGSNDLQKAIISSINNMIDDVCQKALISNSEIIEIDIAANATMMHMLLGIDARPLGKAPYKPLFTKAQNLKAQDIGIKAGANTKLYCLPAVSAYIGADIVAGTYVCGLDKSKENILFIDIGTNGEIVLANKGRLLCCSCAAGPALEGMNISSGMRAEQGAIEDVVITPEQINITTIGDQTPIGLCGSGILAVVRELLKTGLVTKSGAFIKKEILDETDYRYDLIQLNGKKREFILSKDPQLTITQGDVRQVQLAKGAILSGFTALLNRADININQLDKVMIAGQFGAHLPAESLTGTGILPTEIQDKLEYVGNSSKTGAYMTLMSNKVKKEIEDLALKMEYFELAEVEKYERIFADSMIFLQD